VTQQTLEKPELFTDLSAEESATVNGACHYGYRSYRRASYYGYRSYRPRYRYASYYSEYRPRYRYASYYSYRPRYVSSYDCY
jgi:hypothetical protein